MRLWNCEGDEDELNMMAHMCEECLSVDYCDEWWWNINDIGCWEFNKDECESYSQCQWDEWENYGDDFDVDESK